jgi:hypothetical protein
VPGYRRLRNYTKIRKRQSERTLKLAHRSAKRSSSSSGSAIVLRSSLLSGQVKGEGEWHDRSADK